MRLQIGSSLIRLTSCLVLSLLLVACQSGPRQVRGELPLISLESLLLNESSASLQVAVRNVNDRPFELTEVQLDLSLGAEQAVSRKAIRIDQSIPPRGRDVFVVEVGLNPASRALFEQLSEQTRGNLAWQLTLDFDPPRGRLQSEATGFLHPVPGQPGRFR